MHWSNTSATRAQRWGKGGGVCWCWYMWQRRLLGNGSQLTEAWKKNASRSFTSASRSNRGGGGGSCLRIERRRGARQRCVEPHPMWYFRCFTASAPDYVGAALRPSQLQFSITDLVSLPASLTSRLSKFYSNATGKLTPWSRVLPEKLTRPKPPKKFPAFYGTPRFITVLTEARHLSPSWTPPPPTSRRSILILFSHLCLGLQRGLLPSGLSTKALYAPLLAPYVLNVLPISVFLSLSPEWYLARNN